MLANMLATMLANMLARFAPSFTPGTSCSNLLKFVKTFLHRKVRRSLASILAYFGEWNKFRAGVQCISDRGLLSKNLGLKLKQELF